MSVFDWEDFEDDEDYLDYLDSLHHEEFAFDPFAGLFPVVERIREYTHDRDAYTPDVVREIEAVEAYIERGFEDMGAYLARHNEFYTYLQTNDKEA